MVSKQIVQKAVRWGVIGAALLALWGADAPYGVQAVASSTSTISCEGAYQVGYWAWQNTASEKPSFIDDAEFVNRVMDRYLDRIDPLKVLLTRDEAAAFRRMGRASWPAFIADKKCDGFEGWVGVTFPKLEARLERLLKTLPVASYFPKTLPETAKPKDEPAQYPDFAANEAELTARLATLAKWRSRVATRNLMLAFKGDAYQFLKFSLERALYDEEAPNGVHLLARAFTNAVDPYSDYFSDEEYADFYNEMTVGSAAIGVDVRETPQGLLVEAITKNSAAEKSKQLRVGDLILAVDGKRFTDMPSRLWRHALHRDEGVPVQLTVQALAGGKIRGVHLLAQPFATEETRVSWKMVATADGQKLAVIHIPSFYGRGARGTGGSYSSAEDVESSLRQAMAASPTAVVLDLRDNPGGYLDEAVPMAGLFLGKRVVVNVVDPMEKSVRIDTPYARGLYQGPLVVLMDKNSASAAEVLAGALKDHRRAIIVGDKASYGKGSVQKLFPLESPPPGLELAASDRKGVLKLTTSYYYSPMGNSPTKGGIASDWVLPEKKTVEAFEKKPQQHAPAQGPVLPENEQLALTLRERVVAARLAELKESDAVTDVQIHQVFDGAVERAFAGQSLEREDRDKLAESLAVAAEWAKLENSSQSVKSR
ncbi:PDZ domain-containing protein [bacterium]|nr:PDZ domain-containing protein [bacterium]